jgi:hypothetical protein
MSEKREHDAIRLPRRARESLGSSNGVVVLGKGQYQLTLEVKKAYKKDAQRVTRLVRQGKLSDKEATAVGFVTRSVQQRFAQREGNSVWISAGIENITVGADPEFGLIRSNGVLARGNQVVSHRGSFGSDGPSVEVRPAPSNNHIEVVANMSHILANPPAAAEDYRWLGGATYQDEHRVYWFGGHIHLGRPLQLGQYDAFRCYEKIATALDGLLAFPLTRFDTPNPHYRRNGCPYNYGKAGDIRADYPEQDRFEYRVLSGLWFTHPTLAKIVLGAAKAVAETAYSRLADAKFDMDWAQAPMNRKSLIGSFKMTGIQEVRRIINEARAERVTDAHVHNWERWIRNLDRFDDYSEEITALIELVKAAPKGFNLDVRESWQNGHRMIPRGTAKLDAALEAVEGKR